MPPSPELSTIVCGVYSAADAAEMTDLIADAFSGREPIGIALGITHAEFTSLLRLLLPSVESQGLTTVARRADTGEMVGALLTEDGASDSGEELEKLGEKFAAVGSILGTLVETYGDGHHAPGEMLHLFMLAVSRRGEGMGVGQQLVAACCENGARKGYLRAAAECTGRASQHIFRKAGFEDRGTIRYAEHQVNGQHVFASIADHGGVILMEKAL